MIVAVNICCRVLYFSTHRYEYGTFWPNLRQSDYDFIGGRENGRGYNINVPFNKVCHSVCVCVAVCVCMCSVCLSVCVFTMLFPRSLILHFTFKLWFNF